MKTKHKEIFNAIYSIVMNFTSIIIVSIGFYLFAWVDYESAVPVFTLGVVCGLAGKP